MNAIFGFRIGPSLRRAVARGCVLLLAHLPAAAAAAAPPAPPARPAARPAATRPEALTLATYNINFGNPNLPAVAEAIRQASADVVMLQETNAQSAAFLQGQFRRHYPHMRYHAAPAAGGFALLSRLPILRLRVIPKNDGWFAAVVADVGAGGRPVQLVNLHLMPTIPPPGATAADLVRLFLATEAVRGREIRHITAHEDFLRDRPTILAGDLNSWSMLPVPQFLRQAGYTDSFASVTHNPDAQATWRWTTAGGQWRARLDYIFHDGRFQTKTSRIIRTDGSDHYLVVSTLLWRAPSTQGAAAAKRAGARGIGQSPPGAVAGSPSPLSGPP